MLTSELSGKHRAPVRSFTMSRRLKSRKPSAFAQLEATPAGKIS